MSIDAISREAQARGGNFGDFVKHTGEKVGNKVKQGWEWLEKSELGQWFKAHAQNMKRHYKKRIEPAVDFVERNEIGVKQADVTLNEEGIPDSLDVKVGTPSPLEKWNKALGEASGAFNDKAFVKIPVGEHALKAGGKLNPELSSDVNHLMDTLTLTMGASVYTEFITADGLLSSNLSAIWNKLLLFRNTSNGLIPSINTQLDSVNLGVNWQLANPFRLNANANYDFNNSKVNLSIRGNYQNGHFYASGGVGMSVHNAQVSPVLGLGAGINFPGLGSRLGIEGALTWNLQNQEFTPSLGFLYDIAGIFSNY